ncbi:unnamed protein product [Mytilus edulis]|uniref:Hexosyltransferase n=1 Tax=Mytilus edulis TaxID=6550 RepID=A0A8S3SED3_MYTED|nr:unnamed protein product [Mytilus edulis]
MKNGRQFRVMATSIFTFCVIIVCMVKTSLHTNSCTDNCTNLTIQRTVKIQKLQYKRNITIQSKYPTVLTQSYKINNKDICKNISKLSCIVMVYSSPDHFERREALRKTFLNSTFYKQETIRAIFLLGEVYNSSLQHTIERENLVFQDIIQGQFIDSYRNLTYKGVLGFKWISENCPNAEFAAKIDDDVIVNFFKIFQHLSFIKFKRRFLMCDKVNPNLYPIQRDTNEKWNVHNDVFKRMLRYPYTSCLGPAVFISRDLIPILYTTASMSPFFWIEDIYLFGILPSKIPAVVHHGINQNVSYNYQYTADCFGKHRKECGLVVGMPDPEDNGATVKIWNSLIKTIH